MWLLEHKGELLLPHESKENVAHSSGRKVPQKKKPSFFGKNWRRHHLRHIRTGKKKREEHFLEKDSELLTVLPVAAEGKGAPFKSLKGGGLLLREKKVRKVCSSSLEHEKKSHRIYTKRILPEKGHLIHFVCCRNQQTIYTL